MTTATPSPDFAARPVDEPAPPAQPSQDAEVVYFDEVVAGLRPIRRTMELVRRPGLNFVHELRSRFSAAPERPVAILITSRRIVFGGTTYAPANITSITRAGEAKNVGCAMAVIGLGALLFLCNLANSFASSYLNPFGAEESGSAWWLLGAVVLVVLGFMAYQNAKDQYAVEITSASGETAGFMSIHQKPIEAIHQALVAAVAHQST